jgi:hypothetical protein
MFETVINVGDGRVGQSTEYFSDFTLKNRVFAAKYLNIYLIEFSKFFIYRLHLYKL